MNVAGAVVSTNMGAGDKLPGVAAYIVEPLVGTPRIGMIPNPFAVILLIRASA
jgi:hypothetical protein